MYNSLYYIILCGKIQIYFADILDFFISSTTPTKPTKGHNIQFMVCMTIPGQGGRMASAKTSVNWGTTSIQSSNLRQPRSSTWPSTIGYPAMAGTSCCTCWFCLGTPDPWESIIWWSPVANSCPHRGLVPGICCMPSPPVVGHGCAAALEQLESTHTINPLHWRLIPWMLADTRLPP